MSQATCAQTPWVQTLTLQRRCEVPLVNWPPRALLPTLLQWAKGMSSWAFPGSVPVLPRWEHRSYPPTHPPPQPSPPGPLHQSLFFPPCPHSSHKPERDG